MPVSLMLAWVLAQASEPTTVPVSEPAIEAAVEVPAAGEEQVAAEGDIFAIMEEEAALTTNIASGVKSSVLEAPSSVWIIERKTIEDSAATNVLDLLRLVPGMFVTEFTGISSDVNPRGYGRTPFSRVLYTVDGQSVTMDIFGTAFQSLMPFDIMDLERIEVIMGPGSTLHGTNAFSAVINFVTKHAINKGHQAGARVSAGPQWVAIGGNTKDVGRIGSAGHAFGEYSQDFEVLKLRASAFIEGQSSAQLTGPLPEALSSVVPPRRFGGNLDLEVPLKGWTLRAQTRAVAADGADYQFVGVRNQTFSVMQSVRLEKEGIFGRDDELRVWAWGRVQRFVSLIGIPELGEQVIRAMTTSWEVMGRYVAPSFYGNHLAVGLQARVVTAEIGPYSRLLPGGSPIATVGIFVEDEYRPVPWLILTAGLRLESREARATKALAALSASPRAAIVVLPAAGHSLRADFSSAFRFPTVIESFQFNEVLDGQVLVSIANPSVQAERHYLGQIGYQGQLGFLKPRIEGFYGYRKGELNPGEATPGVAIPTVYRNEGDSDYFGGTAYLSAQPHSTLDVAAYYSYVYNRIRTNTGNPASPAGHHLAGLSATFRYDGFHASLQGYYQEGWHAHSGLLGTTQRVILNAMVSYGFGDKLKFRPFLMATNFADLRFGPGVYRDVDAATVERIGPRLLVGLRLDL